MSHSVNLVGILNSSSIISETKPSITLDIENQKMTIADGVFCNFLMTVIEMAIVMAANSAKTIPIMSSLS